MPEYLLNSTWIYVYTTQILQKNDFRNTISISKTKAEWKMWIILSCHFNLTYKHDHSIWEFEELGRVTDISLEFNLCSMNHGNTF
jgi:hypothetical protein